MFFFFLQISELDLSQDTIPKITNKFYYILHTICEIFPKIIHILPCFYISILKHLKIISF